MKVRPSVEGYLAIADRYTELGLTKEAARAYRMAEECEGMNETGASPEPEPLHSGAIVRDIMVEIIQMVMNSQRTGELIVTSAGNSETLRIYFDTGRVINSIGTKSPRGERSFERALSMASGTYKFFEKPVDHVEALFDQGTNHLLLESLQRLDEAQGAAAAAAAGRPQQFDGTT